MSPTTYKASRLLSLLALALGLMAFGATAAQAEPGSFWEVNGAKLTGSASVQVKNDTAHITLLSTSGSSTVEILCGKIKLVNGTLSGTGGSGKIHLEECTTKINGTEAKRCVPHSPGATAGLIESHPLTALLLLHEPSAGTKADILDLAPTSGGAIFLLEFGELCALSSPTNVTGKLTLKDCKNELLVNELEHLIEEGPLSALLFGGNPMKMDGSFWMYLNGANLGQTFSGHPN